MAAASRDAASAVLGAIKKASDSSQPYKAVVTAQAAGLTTIRLPEAATGDDEEYARLVGPAYADGDEVMVLPVNGTPFILGKVQREAGASPVSVITATLAQSAADTTDTTSTSHVDAATRTVSLPAGMWSANVLGSLQLKHSSGGNAAMRIIIGASLGVERGFPVSATTWESISDNHSLSGISGGVNIDVTIQYRSADAGTTSARNPAMTIMFVREAA